MKNKTRWIKRSEFLHTFNCTKSEKIVLNQLFDKLEQYGELRYGIRSQMSFIEFVVEGDPSYLYTNRGMWRVWNWQPSKMFGAVIHYLSDALLIAMDSEELPF